MGAASGSATLVVTDAQCRFPAAHLALHDDSCESLHGHTYTITLRVAGHIETSTGMVLDHRLLKTRLRRVVAPLSHRVLVPGLSHLLTIRSTGGHVRVGCRLKRHLFPSEDVAILHLTNTTTELLARYLLNALDMGTAGGRLQRAELEVAEAPGQVTMGRAAPYKGFEDVLDALVRLRASDVEVPHTVLAAVAEQSEPSHHQCTLARRIECGGLDVTMIRRFDHGVRALIGHPDLRGVVVPSRVEPFGRIPMEVFAHPTATAPVIGAHGAPGHEPSEVAQAGSAISDQCS